MGVQEKVSGLSEATNANNGTNLYNILMSNICHSFISMLIESYLIRIVAELLE